MIGYKLKELRTNNNLTQEDLANKLFVSRSLVAKWEQGRAIPQEEYINKICEILNCSKNDIYEYKDIEESHKKINQYTYLMIFSIAIIVLMIVFSAILGVYLNKKNSYYSNDFSTATKKEWKIESLFMPNNNFVGKPGYNEIIFKSNENEFKQYCNYVYGYLSFNSEIDKLYYLNNLNRQEKTCYYKKAISASSCFYEENMFNVYYVQGEEYYLISIEFNKDNEVLSIRLGSDLIITETPMSKDNAALVEIDFYSVFED
jgi:transcriptional regulator with XRE-family HTH domain